jgi:hypothetical protein
VIVQILTQEQSHRSDHSEAKGNGEPSGGLFIQDEPLGTQFQTQTDDLVLARTDGTAHRLWLVPMRQRLDDEPARQRR